MTGYCHRGIIERIQQQPIEGALALIERTCSLSGTAYRIALCQAIEAATGAKVVRAARLARVLFAEIERILARLWFLGQCARAASLPHIYSEALDQREWLFAALGETLDERVYWAIAVPGGIVGGLELDEIHIALKDIAAAAGLWRSAVSPRGALGRAGKGVGVISAKRAETFQLQGLAARGSCVMPDQRQAQKNVASGYGDIEIAWPEPHATPDGDVAARLVCAVNDLTTSFAIAEQCIEALAAENTSETATPLALPKSTIVEGRATVESPHGPLTVAVALTSEGTLADLRIEPPGVSVLAALPQLLAGVPLDRVPLILTSLDLCMECLDQ